MSLAAGIDAAVAANPGILDTPGLAIDAASSADPLTASPLLTHAANVYATGSAVTDSQTQDDPSTNDSASAGGGFFGFVSKATHFVGSALSNIPGAHGVEHAIGAAAKYLSGPLREVQRDYRFLHTVYAKEGIVSGFLATAGVVAGAAAGSLIGEPLAGASLAAEIERKTAQTGAFGSGLRDAADLASSSDQQISFGRDLAHAVGFIPGLHAFSNTNVGIGKVLSGGADAAADWALDPVVAAAKIKTGLKTGELGALAAAARGDVVARDAGVVTKIRGLLNGSLGVSAQYDALKSAIDRVAPGTTLRPGTEQVARLYGPGEDGSGLAGVTYRRFLDHVVSINQNSQAPSADIARLYPSMSNLAFKVIKDDDGKVMAKGLASATTRAEAQQVMMDVASKADMQQRLLDASVVPTRTLFRAGAQGTAGWLQGISADTTRAEQPSLIGGALTAGKQLLTGKPGDALDTVAAAAAGKVRTFTGYMPFAMDAKTAALSSTEMKWREGIGLDAGGATAAFNAFKFGLGTTNARYYVNQILNAPDFATVRRIWHEANLENLKAMGIPEDDARQMWELRNQSLDYNSPVVGAPGDNYGFGHTLGPDVDKQPNGDANIPAALFSHQTSQTLAFPNFKDALLAQRKAAGAFKANYGKFDDIAYRKYMAPIFKTSALATAGFALRVSAAEVVPQAMRVGIWQHLKDYAAAQSARKGVAMGDQEQEAVVASALHGLSDSPIKGTARIMGRPFKVANAGMWHGIQVMAVDPERAKFAVRLAEDGDGHIASGVASTGEAHGGYSYGAEPQVRAQLGAYVVKDVHANDPRIGWRDTDHFSTFGPYDKQYDGYYHAQLSKAAANVPQRLIAGDLGASDNVDLAVANEEARIKAAIAGVTAVSPADVSSLLHDWQYERGNAALRRQSVRALAGDVTPETQNARRLHAAIAASPPTTNGLFRGVTGTHADEVKNLQVGDNVSLPFAGFTPSATNARRFAEAPKSTGRVVFHLAPGAKAIRPGELADPIEREHYTAGNFQVYRKSVDSDGLQHVYIKATDKQLPLAEANPAYVAEAKSMTGYANIKANNWTAADFAFRRVDAMRGLLHGGDDTYHADIAAQIARGEKPSLEQVSEIPFESRPKQVIGGVRVPYIGPNVMQRVASWGYARVIDPLINHISRDPIYLNSSYKEYGLLKPLVANGVMDDDTAFRLAKTRGAVAMVPKIHNTALRSQFSVLANNFMPFYFAQEQALKRAARLVVNNPNALRQYQLVEQGMNNPGFVKTDASGNKYFIFPGAGVLGNVVPSLLQNSLLFGDQMVSGLPLTVSGSMASLNTLLPEANQPGVSPLISVPLNKLAQIFPELSPLAQDVVGPRGFNQPALAALLPSPITRSLQNVLSPDEANSAFVNSWLTAYASAVYHGKAPGPDASPAEQDAFLARLKNNTRSGFLVKLLLGFVSPLAPSAKFEDAGLRDEFTALVKKVGVPAALQQFQQEHGSKAVSYTVAQSHATIPDARQPYTNQALSWINANGALINSQFAHGAAWLVPQAQGPGDIQVIHSELLRQHLRATDTPQEFAQQIAIAQGEATISPALTVHEQFQKDHANDKAAVANESSNWSDYVATARYNNPIWGNWYTSPQRTNDAVKAYQDLVTMFEYAGQTVTINGKQVKVPEVPGGAQTDAVGELLLDFAQHREVLAQHPTNTVGDSAQRKAEKANWSAFLDEQAKNPILYPIVNAVFRRLDAGLGNP